MSHKHQIYVHYLSRLTSNHDLVKEPFFVERLVLGDCRPANFRLTASRQSNCFFQGPAAPTLTLINTRRQLADAGIYGPKLIRRSRASGDRENRGEPAFCHSVSDTLGGRVATG